MSIPGTHPRYVSLMIREKLVFGARKGITSANGLIAHGRGEAFDYLLGEKTHDFARVATEEAALLLQHATYPVLCVNGNTAALVPLELIALSDLLHAPLEINLFHTSPKRISLIKRHLMILGATRILTPDSHCVLPHLNSPRKYVHPGGIMKADVIFVPLEDGDRTEALIKNGKKVITVDLNPLSRTAQTATVTIVDNIVRALPNLITAVKNISKKSLNYSNRNILKSAEAVLRSG